MLKIDEKDFMPKELTIDICKNVKYDAVKNNDGKGALILYNGECDMLMTKKFQRRRTWQGLFHCMAAAVGLSLVIVFSSCILRSKTYPMEFTDSTRTFTNYKGSVDNSNSLPRYRRGLKFADLKQHEDKLLENNKGEAQKNLERTSLTVDDITTNFSHQSLISLNYRLQQKLENNKEILHELNSSLDSHRNSNWSLKIPVFPTVTSLEGQRTFDTWTTSSLIRNTIVMNKSQHGQLEKNKIVKGDVKSSLLHLKRLPKAIIIGAKKAGTRALLEFLRLHPHVESTGPEPHFFDRNYDKGLEWYRELMPMTYEHQITVEKTPGYFVTRHAPRRIHAMDPSIKLILVVRDPVTRAISDYCQALSKHDMKPFEEMALLNAHLGLVNTSWAAIKIGVYAKHLERWLQFFNLDQIHLVDGQKLIEAPAQELNKVETFLGLPKFINASHFYLKGFKGTFPCLARDGKPHCLDEKTKGREHPVVKESVIQRLRDFYRPFNAKFYQMIGRSFGWT